ncbi:hypothetical protein CspeluHIS016_0203570 [Cutaneotrichosporon spelunceum]|uniref:Uncharacterized protein n=1 Tax=Cutaneotrichosporon spelunceum TaxID=1672016 RepID=A0AAD3TQV9_9TREE|nr:hypothetical protein CspeluHIS016_0203570 [Cutaneotrichosporon spelunceum]
MLPSYTAPPNTLFSFAHRPVSSPSHRLRRPRHRALRGLPPAGAALHLLAADLSDDEGVLDDEREDLNNFGRRFLIPIGRRNTQMEAEAAPSPTPSDHDHRQEDRGGLSPSPEPMEDIDLDASVDDLDAPDLDASLEDLDRSTEYDSEDMALMQEMDQSIGSEPVEESMEHEQ